MPLEYFFWFFFIIALFLIGVSLYEISKIIASIKEDLKRIAESLSHLGDNEKKKKFL